MTCRESLDYIVLVPLNRTLQAIIGFGRIVDQFQEAIPIPRGQVDGTRPLDEVARGLNGSGDRRGTQLGCPEMSRPLFGIRFF